MAHYAKVVDGVVQQVIVADEGFISSLEGEWVKTSYNVKGGVYYESNSSTPASDQSAINDDAARSRKNFAGIGHHYDGTAFYESQPYASWTLNSTSYLWEAPSDMPDDDKIYHWDEDGKIWVEKEGEPAKPYPADGKLYQWDEDAGDWAEIT